MGYVNKNKKDKDNSLIKSFNSPTNKFSSQLKKSHPTKKPTITKKKTKQNPACPYNETTGEQTHGEGEVPPTPIISAFTNSLFGRVSSLATIIRSEAPRTTNEVSSLSLSVSLSSLFLFIFFPLIGGSDY